MTLLVVQVASRKKDGVLVLARMQGLMVHGRHHVVIRKVTSLEYGGRRLILCNYKMHLNVVLVAPL